MTTDEPSRPLGGGKDAQPDVAEERKAKWR